MRTLIFLLSVLYMVLARGLDMDIKTMDEDTYQNWPHMSMLERLPYLLDDIMKTTLTNEFNKLSKPKSNVLNQVDDMTIYDDYIECEDCDYSEDFKDKHRREKDEFGRRL